MSRSTGKYAFVINAKAEEQKNGEFGKTEVIGQAEEEIEQTTGNAVNTNLKNEKKKKQAKVACWEKVRAMVKDDGIWKGTAAFANSGGLVVQFGVLRGFVPYSQLDASRFTDSTESKLEIGKKLVGKNLRLQVAEASEEKNRLIFSEKRAKETLLFRKLKEGQTVDGTVALVAAFGAFVDINISGNSNSTLTGLVHASELTWDSFSRISDVVQVGDKVKVKVLSVDRARNRIGLSIKQLQSDPLLETLDTILTPSSSDSDSDEAFPVLSGLEDIIQELRSEPGMKSVVPGRQAEEKRVVSQDLELWLSNQPEEDGKYKLLARAGRQVQEVQVLTSLSRGEVKNAIQRVLGRVP